MPVNNIAEFYLAHREEIDQGAEDKETPLLALYMSIFRKEAHRLLEEVGKT